MKIRTVVATMFGAAVTVVSVAHVQAQTQPQQEPGALTRAWNATKNGTDKAWDATSKGADKAWDKTKSVSEKGWNATKHGTEKGWNATKNGTVDAAHKVGEWGDDAGKGIKNTFSGGSTKQ